MANPDRLLIDGQLVTATVETGKPEPVLTVPQQALQADQAGLFVLVVDGENKVQVRRVETGARTGRHRRKTGLAAGDRVITEGVQRVRPGQVVEVAEVARGRSHAVGPSSSTGRGWRSSSPSSSSSPALIALRRSRWRSSPTSSRRRSR